MVLEYESLQNWLIFGVNVGIHIPAPWSIWVKVNQPRRATPLSETIAKGVHLFFWDFTPSQK